MLSTGQAVKSKTQLNGLKTREASPRPTGQKETSTELMDSENKIENHCHFLGSTNSQKGLKLDLTHPKSTSHPNVGGAAGPWEGW